MALPGRGLPDRAGTGAWQEQGAAVPQVAAGAAGCYLDDLLAADRHGPPEVTDITLLAVSITRRG